MEQLNKSIKAIFEDYYIVPLYQRNFAWGEEQIVQLIQDIYENYKNAPDTNYYIGSLVTLKRKDEKYEIIDGQQRLTVLSLLMRILGKITESHLSYDSRPEVENFFEAFYQDKIDAINNGDYRISHFIKAAEFIEKAKIVIYRNDKEEEIGFEEIKKDPDFVDYFTNKVIIVRVEMPEYTDVASYFEIMNNRGEQLQKHEIIKSLFLAKLAGDNNKTSVFAKVWDACSEMNIPIHKLFTQKDREILFGSKYDKICSCANLADGGFIRRTGSTITQILKPGFKTTDTIKKNDNEDDSFSEDTEDFEVQSIIDFPNFLMHVFKLVYNGKYKIRLNEKYLIEDYKNIEDELCEPMEFIDYLLTYRTIFDQFVVKALGEEESEETRWVLQKPRKYTKSWKYVNSFNDKQNFIIKALSMLQVTFRQRVYKNYLTKILEWVYDNDGLATDENKYLEFLHGLMLDYFEENYTDGLIEINRNIDIKTGGTNIPHFIFNFIDYLYWYSKNNHSEDLDIKNLDFVEDFDFTYRNSIEHHLPQSFEDDDFPKEIIDSLGNLCLVSKTMNSKMNNEDPKGKASKTGKYYMKRLSPKRKIMYDLTNKENKWGRNEIKKHEEDVIDLLQKRNEILT